MVPCQYNEKRPERGVTYMKTKKKTIYELECEFKKEQKETLQDLLNKSYKKFSHIKDRKFEKRDSVYWGIYHEEKKEYFAFQFCMCSNGESSNIFANINAEKDKAKLETLSPPDGTDFSDGDIICLVKKNKLYVCCSQLRWQQVYYYLNELFIKSKYYTADTIFFKITQKANKELLKKIANEKVKEVTIDLPGTYELFQEYENEIEKQKSTIIQMAMTAFKEYKNKKEILEEPLPIGKLVLKTGRNNIQWMNNETKEITTSSFNYKIFTKKGTTITPDKIKITHTIQVIANGKSVNFEDVVTKMNNIKSL